MPLNSIEIPIEPKLKKDKNKIKNITIRLLKLIQLIIVLYKDILNNSSYKRLTVPFSLNLTSLKVKASTKGSTSLGPSSKVIYSNLTINCIYKFKSSNLA